MNEQQRKAMELALEALEMFCEHGAILNPIETRNVIKEALAQDALQALHDENKSLGLYEPEQEPVAEIHSSTLRWIALEDNRPTNALLYTNPPQRTAAEGEDTRRAWVGLTDEQIEAIEHEVYGRTVQKGRPMIVFIRQFAKSVEAKVKENNNGTR